MIQQLATLMGESWVKLATQLNFEQDDIVYFQTAHKLSTTAQAANMLTLWTVSTSHLSQQNYRSDLTVK